MGMRYRIILLYAGQYSIPDEVTGVINAGVSCSFYMNTDLVPRDNKDGTKGLRPSKGSIDFNLMKKIKRAPAVYDAEFEMMADSKGKTVLKIQDLDYVSDILLEHAPETPAQDDSPGAPDASQEAQGTPDKKKAG